MSRFMSRFALAVFVALLCLAALPAPAEAWWRGGHDGFGWGFGSGVALGVGIGACCGYYPYYSPAYYGYPAYYAPPPATVVYEAPAAPVTYVQPQQQPVYAQQPQPAAQPVAASQASASYTDSSGRTCRNFQSNIDGAPVNGTACLQPDGSWRTVGP
jgi:hypothetical protein